MQTEDRPTEEIEPTTGPRRGLLVGIIAAVAVVVAIAVPFLVQDADDGSATDEQTTPVAQSTGTAGADAAGSSVVDPIAAAPPESGSKATATAFMNAYAAREFDAVESYLADGVDLDDVAMFGDDWDLDHRFMEAVGFEMFPGACTDVSETSDGMLVRCDFDYQNFRSGDAGLGPYGGSSFNVYVGGGLIVAVTNHYEFMTNRWSAEVWEPFYAWIEDNHPDDVAVLYADAGTLQRVTEDSIPVWERRTRQWAAQVAGSASTE